MGDRIHSLTQSPQVPANAVIAIDAPGWAKALKITLSQLKTYVNSHNPVSLSANDMGLSLGSGAASQQLTLSTFNTSHKGAVPKAPNNPDEGLVLNAKGTWTRVFTPGEIGDPGIIIPPNIDGYFGIGGGKYVFGVSETNPYGTVGLYSEEDGVIKTDGKLEIAQGIKLQDGATLQKIHNVVTDSFTFVNKFLPLTFNSSGSEITIHIPVYENLP